MLQKMERKKTDLHQRAQNVWQSFRRPLRLPQRLNFFFAIVIVLIAGALFARAGTDGARAGAGVATLFGLGLLVFVSSRMRRKWASPSGALWNALHRSDKEVAGRVSRAYSLWRRTSRGEDDSAGSPELAELHLERMLAGLSLDNIRSSARSLGRQLWFGLSLLVGLVFSLLLFRPLMILEGVDVLFATHGVGAFEISYVESLSVTAQLPAYLDGAGKKRFVSPRLTSVPQGAELEVRVIPFVQDRALLLTDGIKEIPFVSDGQGALVARWTAESPSSLVVAARFGDVLLYDSHETRLATLQDRAPTVRLEGAPVEYALEELESLELEFLAIDDHGLSQVDLVVISGQRSVRKELVHLDSQKRFYRGAYILTREHELLRQAFLPVHVFIEARDGNTATGPSWGKSKGIVLMPEPLGQQIAERHIALRKFRSALSDFLATDMAAARLSRVDARLLREEGLIKVEEELGELSMELKKAKDVPRRSLAFLSAQVEALKKKGEERASAESVLLAVDSLIQGAAHHEATALSKDLGAAVEELAVQAREIRFDAEGISLEGLKDLLQGAQRGAVSLGEVGNLGLDLGAVAQADLSRVERSLDAGQFDRAEAAAIHLAERLKRATPSFSSKGGGVESGQPGNGGGGSGSSSGEHGESGSNAPSDFRELAKQVDDLAQEAAEELSELERMLQEAARAAQADFQSSPELDSATSRLREALGRLPKNTDGFAGVRGEAAQGRSQGEAMADALDAGDLVEGLERGMDADSALKRAQEMLAELGAQIGSSDIDSARAALKEVMAEGRRALKKLQADTQSKTQSKLKERGARQRALSELAAALAKKGQERQAPLGDEGVSALEQAAALLKKAAAEMDAGRTGKSLELAEEAQDRLENVLPQSEGKTPSAGDGGRDGEEGDGSDGARSNRGSVPDEEKDRALAFRKRVEKGLGRGSGRLSPAVRRYAKELK